jgi:uncharacterized damage-inducible protein DinB
MSISQTTLPEFDHEMAIARKAIERVPDDKFSFKPHPKSPTMGWLAAHIAEIPSWTGPVLEQDSLDMNPPGEKRTPDPAPTSTAQVLAKFDENLAKARAVIEKTTDETFAQPWSLLNGGQALFTLPKAAVLRSFILSHLIHHRAHLGIYLRLNDIPVPAMYGPSADEDMQ